MDELFFALNPNLSQAVACVLLCPGKNVAGFVF
jgi:hypothetical protein